MLYALRNFISTLMIIVMSSCPGICKKNDENAGLNQPNTHKEINENSKLDKNKEFFEAVYDKAWTFVHGSSNLAQKAEALNVKDHDAPHAKGPGYGKFKAPERRLIQLIAMRASLNSNISDEQRKLIDEIYNWNLDLFADEKNKLVSERRVKFSSGKVMTLNEVKALLADISGGYWGINVFTSDEKIEQFALAAIKWDIANCAEYACLVYVLLSEYLPLKKKHIPMEILGLEEYDHAIIVVGRSPSSDLKDPQTWGEEAFIIDPWWQLVGPVSQYVKIMHLRSGGTFSSIKFRRSGFVGQGHTQNWPKGQEDLLTSTPPQRPSKADERIPWVNDEKSDRVMAIRRSYLPSFYTLLLAGKWKEAEDWLGIHHNSFYAEKSSSGVPIVQQLIMDGKTEAVLWLIAHGADLDRVDSATNRNTPLMLASINGLTEVVKAIIAKQKEILNPQKFLDYLNLKNAHSFNALLLATSEGHQETALALISAGADIEVMGPKNYTSLILATYKGLLDVVNVLIEKMKKDDPKNFINFLNQKDTDGFSALEAAIFHKQQEIALVLIKAGANIDMVVNDEDESLFMEAADKGLTIVVKAMMEKKRSTEPENFIKYIKHKNIHGEDAYDIANSNGHHETADAIKNAL